MNLKALRNLSFLGLAGLTLVSCGSKPKSISCDGLNFYGDPLSYIADQEKIVINLGGSDLEQFFAVNSGITVEGSKITITPDKEVEEFLGEGPYELSLKTCPTEVTPAVQYFIP